MENRFEPELVLDHAERSHLAAIMVTPGYHILHRVIRSEVDKFLVHLMNTDEGAEKDIIARFKLSKAAVQVYEGMTKRLNEERLQYENAPRENDKPLDATEGVLDFGALAEQFQDVPNLLEEAGI